MVRHRLTKRVPLPRPAAAPEKPARAVVSRGAEAEATKESEPGIDEDSAGSEPENVICH